MNYDTFLNFVLEPRQRRALQEPTDGWDTTTLFLYGTLLAGQRNDWLTAGLLESGHLRLRGEGYGTGTLVLDAGGLPAMYSVMSRNLTRVMGTVYTCTTPALRALDVFEGSGTFYHRGNISALQTHGRNGRALATPKSSIAMTYFGPRAEWTEAENALCYARDGISDFRLHQPVPVIQGMAGEYIQESVDGGLLVMIGEDE